MIRTVGAALEDVALHLEVAVLGAQVDVGGEHHLDVLLLLGQRPRRASACRRRHGVWGCKGLVVARRGGGEGSGYVSGSGGANGRNGRRRGVSYIMRRLKTLGSFCSDSARRCALGRAQTWAYPFVGPSSYYFGFFSEKVIFDPTTLG